MAKELIHGVTRHVEIVGPWRTLPGNSDRMQSDINARLKALPQVEIDGDEAFPVDVRIAPYGDQIVCVLTYRDFTVKGK